MDGVESNRSASLFPASSCQALPLSRPVTIFLGYQDTQKKLPDHEALHSGDNGHGVAIGKETVTLAYCLGIGGQDLFPARQGGDQKEQ